MRKLILAIFMCMLVALSTIVVACGHRHTYSDKWSSDEEYHWHAATCGHEDAIIDKAAHHFDADNKCTECGYEKKNSPTPDTHKHIFSEEWSKDATYHWHDATCGHDVVGDKAEHSFDGNGKCTECGYQEELLSPMQEVEGLYYQWAFDVAKEDYVINKSGGVQLNSDGTGKIFSDGVEFMLTFTLDGSAIKVVMPVAAGVAETIDGYVKDGILALNTDEVIYYIKENINPFKKLDNIIYCVGVDGSYCVVRAANKDITSLAIKSDINGEIVTAITGYAFDGCDSIKSVQLPESIVDIGNYAFRNCSSLTSITIPVSVTNLGDGTFYNCNSLKNIVILSGVTRIGDSTFRECSSLESIIIPSNVMSIGDYAFYGCSSLVEALIINGGVKSMGDYAFYGCSSLKSITIPNGVTSIGNYAFYWCESLASVTISDSVTSIGEYAFQLCSSLENIIIPKNITSIGKGAFGGFWFLGGLKTVYYKGDAEEWENINIGADNGDLTSASRYYYRDQEPTDDGNYWHYVGGVATVWGKEE